MPGGGREEAIAGDHFADDTVEFIRLLQQHGVLYVIVGGQAVIYHGHARFTGDVDFFYEDSRENVDRLWKALTAFWDGGAVPGLESASELSEPAIVVQFGRPPNRIDLMNRIEGVAFESAWKSHIEVPLEVDDPALMIPFINLDCLIENKGAVGRGKDNEDLKYLLKMRERRDAGN